MKEYQVDVVEVRHVSCTYTVEAESFDEAVAMASAGVTVGEIENGKASVVDRHICSPEELEEQISASIVVVKCGRVHEGRVVTGTKDSRRGMDQGVRRSCSRAGYTGMECNVRKVVRLRVSSQRRRQQDDGGLVNRMGW